MRKSHRPGHAPALGLRAGTRTALVTRRPSRMVGRCNMFLEYARARAKRRQRLFRPCCEQLESRDTPCGAPVPLAADTWLTEAAGAPLTATASRLAGTDFDSRLPAADQ